MILPKLWLGQTYLKEKAAALTGCKDLQICMYQISFLDEGILISDIQVGALEPWTGHKCCLEYIHIGLYT